MRLNRKTRISLALFAIMLACLGGTMAYFATTDTAHNVISTGGVKIAILEFSDPTGNSSDDLVPFEDINDIIPGKSYSKIPLIKNIDTEPVWVRAQLTLTKTSPDGTVAPIPDLTSVLELEEVSSDWTPIDRYYYYNSTLATDETTSPLFKRLKFKDSLNLLDVPAGTVYSLTVDAIAVQASHNGSNTLEAGGWDD